MEIFIPSAVLPTCSSTIAVIGLSVLSWWVGRFLIHGSGCGCSVCGDICRFDLRQSVANTIVLASRREVCYTLRVIVGSGREGHGRLQQCYERTPIVTDVCM